VQNFLRRGSDGIKPLFKKKNMMELLTSYLNSITGISSNSLRPRGAAVSRLDVGKHQIAMHFITVRFIHHQRPVNPPQTFFFSKVKTPDQNKKDKNKKTKTLRAPLSPLLLFSSQWRSNASS
jgi:hypothetical protein